MEKVVQQTDYDALSCRLAAISKGYLPSVAFQVQRCNYHGYKEMHMEYLHSLKSVSRRIHSKIFRAMQNSFPVMNYGTYLRTVSIDIQINDFLKSHSKFQNVQIINLGCGSDLRMIPIIKNFTNVTYIDIDYKDSIEMKRKILDQNRALKKALESDDDGETNRYKLISCDLNDEAQTVRTLSESTSSDSPTIVISECVLCYMDDHASKQLISVVLDIYKTGIWISYDPIGGSKFSDRFGIIMQSNLRESRHLEMPTLMIYNSKETYSSRFANCNVEIKDMWDIFENDIPKEEISRLKSLQFLDEVEELKIMQTHYVLLKASW
ncbi:hypothetical protein HG535_0D05130 [Zygotorulaspora mrakii]|uniref:Leucine carboxyl methyltransferase 1 n=1 Tax=Zygotorulaspora mrakii TaxID=42260 RepID=A0A7H9B335_ZYGMR|nr:uncharacterized protein HG535_0D05130 [Zygotorulaspora mrakii]QLG72804.1 hypothetical protein HG535_0D05130 [Zygotorulaspora mrakii]